MKTGTEELDEHLASFAAILERYNRIRDVKGKERLIRAMEKQLELILKKADPIWLHENLAKFKEMKNYAPTNVHNQLEEILQILDQAVAAAEEKLTQDIANTKNVNEIVELIKKHPYTLYANDLYHPVSKEDLIKNVKLAEILYSTPEFANSKEFKEVFAYGIFERFIKASADKKQREAAPAQPAATMPLENEEQLKNAITNAKSLNEIYSILQRYPEQLYNNLGQPISKTQLIDMTETAYLKIQPGMLPDLQDDLPYGIYERIMKARQAAAPVPPQAAAPVPQAAAPVPQAAAPVPQAAAPVPPQNEEQLKNAITNANNLQEIYSILQRYPEQLYNNLGQPISKTQLIDMTDAAYHKIQPAMLQDLQDDLPYGIYERIMKARQATAPVPQAVEPVSPQAAAPVPPQAAAPVPPQAAAPVPPQATRTNPHIRNVERRFPKQSSTSALPPESPPQAVEPVSTQATTTNPYIRNVERRFPKQPSTSSVLPQATATTPTQPNVTATTPAPPPAQNSALNNIFAANVDKLTSQYSEIRQGKGKMQWLKSMAKTTANRFTNKDEIRQKQIKGISEIFDYLKTDPQLKSDEKAQIAYTYLQMVKNEVMGTKDVKGEKNYFTPAISKLCTKYMDDIERAVGSDKIKKEDIPPALQEKINEIKDTMNPRHPAPESSKPTFKK